MLDSASDSDDSLPNITQSRSVRFSTPKETQAKYRFEYAATSSANCAAQNGCGRMCSFRKDCVLLNPVIADERILRGDVRAVEDAQMHTDMQTACSVRTASLEVFTKQSCLGRDAFQLCLRQMSVEQPAVWSHLNDKASCSSEERGSSPRCYRINCEYASCDL